MVGAKGRLAELQRPLVLDSGPGQVPKVLQHAAQGVTPPGDLWVVWAEGRLSDRQGARSAIGLAWRYWLRSRR